MKLQDFNEYFLNYFPTTLVSSKKPVVKLKKYLVFSRVGSYYCINFLQYFKLLQLLVFFLQSALSSNSNITFFFDNKHMSAMYQEISRESNTFCAYTPRAFRWLSSWTPHLYTSNLGDRPLNCYTQTSKSIAIFCDVNSLFIPYKLITQDWPIIMCLPLSTTISMELSALLDQSIYFIPTQHYVAVAHHYFIAAFFSKVICAEKQRLFI